MPRLLIVHHTPSPAVRALLEAAVEGTKHPDLQADMQVEPALSATASDLLAADAVLLITPANIGYMSGAMKHFFDTVYYPCLDVRRGLVYALVVHGNDDTTGAIRSVTTIAKAMQWVPAAQPLSVVGAPASAELEAVAEMAATLIAVSSS